jgi:carboxypeptidase C (cathepsin A)
VTSITRRDLLAGALAVAATPAFAEVPAIASGGPFVTKHSGVFGGRTVDYVATVGETVITDEKSRPTIRFVTTSHVAIGTDPRTRPVLFLFNGGPSACSSFLHILALGPKRLVVSQDPATPEVPTRTTSNLHTILDVADLVFVDPAETGFSRILAAGSRDDFYSVNGDAQSVSDFVVAWVRANGRETSPKYVLGESYGTIRAAVMAGQLAEAMPLDGVFLLSQAVNMIETSQRAKNALAYATNLPALAAVAAYHGRAGGRPGRTPAAIVDDAYAFGMGEYLQALVRGNDLPASRRRGIAATLERLTGISAEYYLAHDLAITKIEFTQELLKDRGQFMSMYDARYVGYVPPPGQERKSPLSAIIDSASALFERYLADDLGVTWPVSEYRDEAPGSEAAWAWNGTLGPGGPFLDYDYPARLSEAFRANPRFRLMTGTGYFDLTTTIGPARYLVTQSDYPRERVFQRQYVGGHLVYLYDPSLAAFTADLRAWVTGGAPT